MTSRRGTYVLGINEGVVATACLLCDGVVVACASEERLTRQKNQAGIPWQAIQYCLTASGITADHLACVAFSTAAMPPFLYAEPGAPPVPSPWWFEALGVADRWLTRRRGVAKQLEQALYRWGAPRAGRALLAARTRVTARQLGIPETRIRSFDHHLTHGAAALWSAPFVRQGKDVLVLTCDGEGDLLSATVSEYRAGRWTRLASTSLADSLGHFYSAVTEHLGMRPHDHEYKVMGLAPYAPPAQGEALLRRLRGWFKVRDDLTLQAAVHLRAGVDHLRPLLKGARFDVVAAATQGLTEEVLTAWAARAMARTGLRAVAVGGGVFMNVKANLRLAALPELRELFVMPSPGDESTALGAAYCAYHALHPGAAITPVEHVYWGPSVEVAEIRQALASRNGLSWNVTEPAELSEAAATLLAQGHVIARVSGRMEWGARALGHRSLLADAAQPRVVEVINRAIKRRDFWMPFAPTILDTAQTTYLQSPDPAKVNTDFMMTAFVGTPQAARDLAGAMHPYDRTLRPQCVRASTDPQYYEILQRFAVKTSRYGILNTSYNIHGEPIVCSAEDALSTFERSGVNHLLLGPYVVSKRAPVHDGFPVLSRKGS